MAKKNGSNKRRLKPTPKRKQGVKPAAKKTKAIGNRKAIPKAPNKSKSPIVRRLKPKKIQKAVPKIKAPQKQKKRPLTDYEKADTLLKIKNLIKRKGRLRHKGKFITNEAQEKVLKFSGILDKEKNKYNLAEIMSIPQIQKKFLITVDETGKDLFYWNVQNQIKKNAFGEDIKLVLKDFEGNIVYEGKSEIKAVSKIYEFNRKIANLEKVIALKEDIDNIYATIPVFETRRDGETIKLVIDYSQLKTRQSLIKKDLWNKYRSML